MPAFRDLKSLNTYLNVVLEEVLIAVADKVEQKVVDSTYTKIYTYNNDIYKRTYDYLASITRAEPKFNNGTIDVEIFYDPNKMLPRETTNRWNEHMNAYGQVEDIWNGMSVPELLPLWIEKGTERGLYPRTGVHVLETVYENLKDNYKTLFKTELKKYGIKVK